MREIELRRHTMRQKPGQHLKQAGVSLARRVGGGMGPFDRVVTSQVPRAFETAIAMGFAVDEQWAEISSVPDDVLTAVSWLEGCAAFQAAARRDAAVRRFCAKQARVLGRLAASLPEGGHALVVSHGGIVEAQVVGCLPDYDYSAWGATCGYCEGVRLRFDGGRFTGATLLRVPGALLET